MHRIIIIIWYIILAWTSVFSQVLTLHTYTIMNGLPSNTIMTITQDSKGYLWIGTFDGITMYDGTSFHNYRKQEGLGGVVVISTVESRKAPGNMFVGTINGGISVVRNNKAPYSISSPTTATTSPSSIVEDAGGTLWCAVEDAVIRVKNGSILDTILVFPKTVDAYLAYIDTLIAVGVGSSIHFYSINGREIRTLSLNQKALVLRLYVDNKKNLWVTTSDSSLMEYRGDTLLGKCKLPVAANDLAFDPDGFLWFATKSGLMKLPINGWTKAQAIIYGKENGLPDQDISCVFVDAEKNLWIATLNKGLVKLTDKTTLKFHLPGTTSIQSLAVDNFGNVWHTNPPNGIWEFYRELNGIWRYKLHELNLSTKVLGGRIIFSRKNTLWAVLSDRFIIVFLIHHVPGKPSLLEQSALFQIPPPSQEIYYIYIDRKQQLWCSVLSSNTVLVYDVSGIPRLLRTLKFPKDISVSSVRAIDSDTLGNIWLGGFADGLERISPGWKTRHFTTQDGLPDNSIRSMEKDDRGRLWIGTRYGGIAVYDGTRFTNISTAQGLLSNTVWSLSYNGHHKMWLGSPLGPLWVSTADFNEMGWYNSTIGYETFLCLADKEQRLWARTADEIILCDYGKRTPNTVPPPVYISSIRVNGKLITSLASIIEVPYDKNTWAIRYVGLSFRDERSVRFRYRLIGSSTEWSAPTPERSVIFAALKPGSYRFEVEAINSDGVSSLLPAAIRFTILPPFWLRWWFILLIASVLGGATILVLYSRFKRLKEEQHRQAKFSQLLIELQEKERKRIASELHDGLGQNLLIIKNLAEMGNVGTLQDPKQYLDDISNIAGRSVAEVREIAHNLRPHLLDKLGLTKCLRAMVRQVAESSSISISEKICQLENFFSPEEEMNIYRIVQEGVNNIIKHSEATEASVTIAFKDNLLSIIISDNGKGFLINRKQLLPPSQSGEFGLITMEERVKLLHGKLRIISVPGKETQVKVKIPISGRKNDNS